MNGALNVFAALLLGGAIIAAGWLFSRNQDAAALTEAELEQFKADYIKEAQESMTANCSCCADLADAEAQCEADIAKMGSLEQPYAAGVAVSDISANGVNGDQTAASSQSYIAERKTAVLGASLGGDDSGAKPVDKPDSKEYFTENKRLTAADKSATRIDKPDTKEYFTEKRRIDGKPVDKPDSSEYFTENKRMKDPCIRDDGTQYTGPGTADDPFAPGDPCLVEQHFAYTPPAYEDPCLEGRTMPKVNEFLDDSDPCVTDVTELPPPPVVPEEPPRVAELPPGWTSPYQTYGPEFPRTTLGPRGSDYPRQMAMVYHPTNP